jgi:hypothetical protein
MRRIGLAVVLAVSLTLAPLAVEAQQAEKVYRIGFLNQGSGTPVPFLTGYVTSATWKERTLSSSTDGPSLSARTNVAASCQEHVTPLPFVAYHSELELDSRGFIEGALVSDCSRETATCGATVGRA